MNEFQKLEAVEQKIEDLIKRKSKLTELERLSNKEEAELGGIQELLVVLEKDKKFWQGQVKNSMEKIEQQINQLTTQIEDVSSDIKTVEFYLKKPSSSWTEEEKETYGTKEQLRIKEEHLRSEKKQLRVLLIEKERQKTQDDISSTKPVLTKSKSDQFILYKNLNLQERADVVQFLCHKMNVLAPYNPAKPYQAGFLDNCLEFRLDVRQTKYQLDNKNDIKIQLAVSGAGKTRKLLELLYIQIGYYFVIDLQLEDFGSGDMAHCYQYSVNAPKKTGFFIELLYFVRVFVCNYLLDLGYVQPQQLLLAQLHPIQFFGIDIFKELFDSLAKRSDIMIGRKIENCFDFVAIDEIQRSLEGKKVFNLPGSTNDRPFFSPLVWYSKLIGKFPKFIVSGTGINFEYIKELMLSGTFKMNQVTSHQVISDFQPLKKEQTEQYIKFILSEHNIKPAVITGVVDLIANNELFLGPGRFVAFLLETYLADKDIDLAISEFGQPQQSLFSS